MNRTPINYLTNYVAELMGEWWLWRSPSRWMGIYMANIVWLVLLLAYIWRVVDFQFIVFQLFILGINILCYVVIEKKRDDGTFKRLEQQRNEQWKK